jgi:hypothetical protein
MQVPVDDTGMITVMVFADGFAPLNQIVTPEQAAAYPIEIFLDQNSPSFQVIPTYESSITEGRFVVSGTISYGAVPVCALVLANGVSMFSCNENNGLFSLDVPLDQDGNITLMVFAAGFKPYKIITNVVLDTDQDGIKDYLDYDDDNDGIFDLDDPCPQVSGQECKPISDIVTANGKVWAQVSLFTNLSWSQISAICPAGVCVDNGMLNGYNMSGWRWASVDDVNALFNFYGVSPALGPGPDWRYAGPADSEFAKLFFTAGWMPTLEYSGNPLYTQLWCAGHTSTLGRIPPVLADRYVAGIEMLKEARIESGTFFTRAQVFTSQSTTDGGADETTGAWFFRSP